ncbi:MAG: cupredoxin family protein [Burkholderiales bacterium]|jgi:uncharacterized cupredoxin-like copper-binding protein|nr:cupredoxin family protein [Burkholderiales bacterium]
MHYLIVAVAALLVAAAAQAHGLQAHGQGPNLEMIDTAFGRTGDPKKVTRTVDIEMLDTMRFKPDSITVRQGDTLRLRVRNAGKALHELVIGTDKELQEHAELMKKHPDMEHDEPYMAHVDPGKRNEIVWQFTRPGDFKFACLIPGHFEAGMVGTIKVLPR